VLCVPLTGRAPDQAPEAAHAVVLVDVQESVALPSAPTLLGLALIVTLGTPSTVTVAAWVALPPTPVQVRTYLAVESSGPVFLEPLVATDPLQAPEAVQPVLLVEFQASVADWPLATAIRLGDSATVGVAAAGVLVVVVVPVVPVVPAGALVWLLELVGLTPPPPQADNPAVNATISSKCRFRVRPGTRALRADLKLSVSTKSPALRRSTIATIRFFEANNRRPSPH
jgi:hypothetical protein